ncbi:Toll-like receptor Tollo [Gryllus bimaculatus]|nr:Toll-like receptor Tollo [Gryllus bimaculatus]
MGKLLPRLEGSNPRYRLCLHERDFPLGSLIVQNIVECMARSRHTIMILTPAFVGSQWCQWELEMATHRLLEGAGRDFLVLVELQPLDAKALPRLLRLLVETRTFLQWPSGCAPGGGCGGGAEEAEEAAWRRLRTALGPPIKRSSRHGLSSHASALAHSLQALDSPPPAPASPHPPETTVAVRSVALVKDKDSFLPEEDIQLSTLT